MNSRWRRSSYFQVPSHSRYYCPCLHQRSTMDVPSRPIYPQSCHGRQMNDSFSSKERANRLIRFERSVRTPGDFALAPEFWDKLEDHFNARDRNKPLRLIPESGVTARSGANVDVCLPCAFLVFLICSLFDNFTWKHACGLHLREGRAGTKVGTRPHRSGVTL